MSASSGKTKPSHDRLGREFFAQLLKFVRRASIIALAQRLGELIGRAFFLRAELAEFFLQLLCVTDVFPSLGQLARHIAELQQGVFLIDLVGALQFQRFLGGRRPPNFKFRPARRGNRPGLGVERAPLAGGAPPARARRSAQWAGRESRSDPPRARELASHTWEVLALWRADRPRVGWLGAQVHR